MPFPEWVGSGGWNALTCLIVITSRVFVSALKKKCLQFEDKKYSGFTGGYMLVTIINIVGKHQNGKMLGNQSINI